MANAKERKQMEAMVREEDLQDLQGFRQDLQSRIDQAHDDGRAYMMAQYVVMMATVSCEIKRIQARFERESLASTRKQLKDLKAQKKGASGDDENEA